MAAWDASWHGGVRRFASRRWSALALMEAPRRCARCIRPMWRAGPGSSPPTMRWCRFISVTRALWQRGRAGCAGRPAGPRGGRRAAWSRAGGRLLAAAVWFLPRRPVRRRQGERAGDPAYPGAPSRGSLAGGDHEPDCRAAGHPGPAARDGKPFWVSFTLEDEAPGSEPTLRSGEREWPMRLPRWHQRRVDAILFNCCQPEVIEEALRVAGAALQEQGCSDIRLGAYANAFPPQPKEATANDGLDEIRTDLGPLDYLGWAERWRAAGANLIGGCCGIGPAYPGPGQPAALRRAHERARSGSGPSPRWCSAPWWGRGSSVCRRTWPRWLAPAPC